MGAVHKSVGKVPAASVPLSNAELLGRGAAVGPGVESAIGLDRHRQADRLQRGNEVVAAGLELGAAAFVFGNAFGLEASQGRILRHGAGADEQVLGQHLYRCDQRLRHHHPTQAPARHIEVFAEAVDGDDVVTKLQGRLAKGFVIGQAQIDFIDDGQPALGAHDFVDAAQLVGRNRGARGVGGRGQHHAARALAPGGFDLGGAELEALRRR